MTGDPETSAGSDENSPVRRLADWSPVCLHELVTEHGTPLSVIDLARVRENTARLQRAFPDAELCVRRETIADLARCER